MTFHQLCRSYTGHGFPEFRDLDEYQQRNLVGAYLFETYTGDDSLEPINEALTPDIGAPSKHALDFYREMSNDLDWEWKVSWCNTLMDKLCKQYAGVIQAKLEEMDKEDQQSIGGRRYG